MVNSYVTSDRMHAGDGAHDDDDWEPTAEFLDRHMWSRMHQYLDENGAKAYMCTDMHWPAFVDMCYRGSSGYRHSDRVGH